MEWERATTPREGCGEGARWGGEAGDWEHEQYHATARKHILQQANMLFCCVCLRVSARIRNGSLLNSHTGHRGETVIL